MTVATAAAAEGGGGGGGVAHRVEPVYSLQWHGGKDIVSA